METTNDVAVESSAKSIGDQYLTFVLSGEEYAVEILKVQEIKSWSPATPIPCAPDYMLGVINLRGSVVPVIDLRRRFGLPPTEYTATTAVIIARTNVDGKEKVAGLVVDEVADVYHLGASKIQESSEIAGSIDSNFIQGLAQENEKLIILINLEKIVESSLELLEFEEDEQPQTH